MQPCPLGMEHLESVEQKPYVVAQNSAVIGNQKIQR